MKDYYALLRVSRTATDAEIKQAFRRLAILLHPDKNPHPDAPMAFQEVNEAYEVLGDAIKRMLYDQMLSQEEGTPIVVQHRHRDPAYRRRPPGYKPAPRAPSAGYLAMMKLMPYTNWVSVAALVISFFVWLDYTLPRDVSKEVIVEWHRRLNHHEMITDKGHTFQLLYPQNLKFLKEPELNVYKSKMFSFLDRIETKSGSHKLNNLPTVFRNFIFGPIVLMVLGAIGQLLPKGEAKFNISIAIVILLLLNVVFIFRSVW
jgi:hypothetical protein